MNVKTAERKVNTALKHIETAEKLVTFAKGKALGVKAEMIEQATAKEEEARILRAMSTAL